MINTTSNLSFELTQDYPCIKMNKVSELVILFVAPQLGTVIKEAKRGDNCVDTHIKLGEYRDWAEENLKCVSGKIKLKNS